MTFAVHFVQHLRQSGIDCGESADDSFVACELFETSTCANEIAIREHKEQIVSVPNTT